MSLVILCIDDMPIRYHRLADVAKDHDVMVLVTCRLEDVNFYLSQKDLYQIIGICLDHDMPNLNGDYYAKNIFSEKNIPVVISSHNPDGALKIEEYLNDYETPNILLPSEDSESWAKFAMAFFIHHRQKNRTTN